MAKRVVEKVVKVDGRDRLLAVDPTGRERIQTKQDVVRRIERLDTALAEQTAGKAKSAAEVKTEITAALDERIKAMQKRTAELAAADKDELKRRLDGRADQQIQRLTQLRAGLQTLLDQMQDDPPG